MIELSPEMFKYKNIREISIEDLEDGIQVNISGHWFEVSEITKEDCGENLLISFKAEIRGDRDLTQSQRLDLYGEEDIRSNSGKRFGIKKPAGSYYLKAVIKAMWINAYIVVREYGGPEEGGWYWNRFVFKRGIMVWNGKEAAKAREILQERYENEVGLYKNDFGFPYFKIFVEDIHGESETTRKPQYG